MASGYISIFIHNFIRGETSSKYLYILIVNGIALSAESIFYIIKYIKIAINNHNEGVSKKVEND